MSILKRTLNAWQASRFRQYELRLSRVDSLRRDAVVIAKILRRTVETLQGSLLEISQINEDLMKRNNELVEQARRRDQHIHQLELALGDPEHVAALGAEMACLGRVS